MQPTPVPYVGSIASITHSSRRQRAPDRRVRENTERMQTHVLYISSVPSPDEYLAMKHERLAGAQEVTYGMIESGFKFHRLIQDGLVADPQTSIYSVCGRAVTPKYYRGGWWRSRTDRLSSQIVVHHPAFFNGRGIKQAWLALSFVAHTLRWRLATGRDSERILIADAAYITALPGVLAALAGSATRKVAIFADVYSYMAPVTDATHRGGLVHGVARRVAAATYARFDGVVILTEAMNPVVNPHGKPALVMEGLADFREAERDNSASPKAALPTALYAGALRAEYGLDALVEGFRRLPDPDVRLSIYGAGDYADQITEAAREDPRIQFHGSVPIDEVVEEEKRAWVLVNPRPTDREFTKYSFPSKTMEYLASGTATLSTRLPGIPEEYFGHMLSIYNPGSTGITEALGTALRMPAQRLAELGRSGKEFVMREKNHVRQSERILDFGRSLS